MNNQVKNGPRVQIRTVVQYENFCFPEEKLNGWLCASSHGLWPTVHLSMHQSLESVWTETPTNAQYTTRAATYDHTVLIHIKSIIQENFNYILMTFITANIILK